MYLFAGKGEVPASVCVLWVVPAPAAGEDKEVKIWNLETSEEVCVLMGHKAKVTALHFSEGGRFVFSGDASGLLLVRPGSLFVACGRWCRELGRFVWLVFFFI